MKQVFFCGTVVFNPYTQEEERLSPFISKFFTLMPIL